MQIKTLFKASSISYSQFLYPKDKKPNIHCLTEEIETSIDINFFKRSIFLHYQHVYAKKKWQNLVYRFIFFSFGLLFLILSIFIFFKTVNFACGFYFKNCLMVKHYLNMTCLLLAGGAFAIGYKIHPEKEAFGYLSGKVERELSYPSKHVQIEFNAIIANLIHERSSHQTLTIK